MKIALNGPLFEYLCHQKYRHCRSRTIDVAGQPGLLLRPVRYIRRGQSLKSAMGEALWKQTTVVVQLPKQKIVRYLCC